MDYRQATLLGSIRAHFTSINTSALALEQLRQWLTTAQRKGRRVVLFDLGWPILEATVVSHTVSLRSTPLTQMCPNMSELPLSLPTLSHT